MSDCIFCRLVASEIPAHRLAETNKALAFLDLHPIRPGHALVIPKVHTPNFQDLPEEDYLAVMSLAKKVAKKIELILKPQRVGLMTIGWDVPHAHVHVVPMHEHGDVTSKVLLEKKCGNPTQAELAEMAKQLSF